MFSHISGILQSEPCSRSWASDRSSPWDGPTQRHLDGEAIRVRRRFPQGQTNSVDSKNVFYSIRCVTIVTDVLDNHFRYLKLFGIMPKTCLSITCDVMVQIKMEICLNSKLSFSYWKFVSYYNNWCMILINMWKKLNYV